MRSLVFSVAMLAGLLASGAVWADTECNVPVSAWQSREVLRKELEQQGLQVQRIKVDDGCYEVRGVDVQGKRFKSKYAPDSLKVLQLETKDDERGERRRERSQGSK
jgi:hypothetical protein